MDTSYLVPKLNNIYCETCLTFKPYHCYLIPGYLMGARITQPLGAIHSEVQVRCPRASVIPSQVVFYF